jgi:hypothetical protein
MMIILNILKYFKIKLWKNILSIFPHKHTIKEVGVDPINMFTPKQNKTKYHKMKRKNKF